MRRLLRQLDQDSRASQEQRVELNSMLKEVIATCAKGGSVPLAYAEQPPLWVIARVDRLRSVFTHVITNAQEATCDGGEVEVTLQEHNAGALIQVRDKGEGMTEEFIHRRLFKPFETTKGSSGMGIGAYQAREIIRALGGDITVQSAIGRGTTMSITLPAAQAADGRQAAGTAG
jgi:signal transduction histidine kinase